ncbi:N-acetyltransferase [Klebsiella pneumoniae]|uniref:N-acetyltransferase n=1 Tax=Klebsiella pneumoniae TaxID=573 RepID=UPI000A77A126
MPSFYQRKLLARQRRGSTGCLSSRRQHWVWEQDGELKGFVSVLDSRFVGALFVAPGATRQGIGRALLDEVKRHYAWLSLEVYQKNESAVSFYHAQGFRIEDCAWQDDTQHPTWIMRWPADQMP